MSNDGELNRKPSERPFNLNDLVGADPAGPAGLLAPLDLDRPLMMWPFRGPKGGTLYPVRRVFRYGTTLVLAAGVDDDPDATDVDPSERQMSDIPPVSEQLEQIRLSGELAYTPIDRKPYDPEVNLFQTIVPMLEAMDPAERARTVSYLNERYG